jgi:hypothetical protein
MLRIGSGGDAGGFSQDTVGSRGDCVYGEFVFVGEDHGTLGHLWNASDRAAEHFPRDGIN